MKPTIHPLFRSALLPSLLVLGQVPSATAANITWGSATTITGDAGSGIAVKNFQPNNNATFNSTNGTADIFSTGTSVFAMNFTGVSGDTWINRVTFFESTPQETIFRSADEAGALTQNGVTLTFGPGWIGNTRIAGNSPQGSSYGANPGFTWDTLSYMRYMNATAGTLTFSGLTIGQEYAIQYWVQDSRTGAGDINERNLTLAGSTPVTLDYNNGAGVGQWAVGTFTADSATQDISITANSSVQIGMIQLRALPVAFTSADGIWTGGDGNWSTASNWDANTIGQGIDKSATFNGLTPVTAAVDVIRPIGALLFSGANHTLSNGTGNLTLDGDITYPTPTVDVAAGFTATVNATLSGTEGLLKSGPGTLVLGGTSSYSGTTSITAGTLSYAGASFVSATHDIDTGAALEFNVASGTYNAASTTINGGGTLRKIGAGNLIWPATVATFALDPGALIDVQGGTFTAGSFGNENWAANASDLNVDAGAVFSTVEANVRVDKITGSGTIGTGYSGGGYQNLTIGVADGSSTFNGVITNTDDNPAFVGNLLKVGTGTIALTGANTYTGTTTVEAGTLSLGNGTNNSNLSDLATVSIALGATVNLNFLGTNSDVVGKLIIDGNTLSGGTYDSTHPIYGSYFTGTGSLTVLDQNGTWSSLASGNWNTSSNWLSDTIATGSGKTATFSAGTGSETITVTLDSDRDIGNLAFSNATYNLAGGSTLTLDGLTTPTISVASGLTTTVTAKLAGTVGLVKSGPGTLALDAGNGDNYANVYNQNVSGGLNITEGTVDFTSQFIRMGSITIGNGATLRTTEPWTTGSSNPWFNGRSAGSITVEAGGTLTSTTIANALVEGLTLNGGSVTAPGITNGDWGAFVIASTVTADGAAASSISAELSLVGNQTFDVVDGSTLDASGVIHNRFAATAGAITKEGLGTLILGGVNSYTGNTTINGGTLELADNAQLTFIVSDSGQNIVGGTGAAIFRGDFAINTSAVTGTTGGIWLLVDRNALTGESFESTFTVIGFDDSNNDGVWTMTDAKGDWSFDESTGELTLDLGNDYDDWADIYGLAPGSEAGDADNDGLTNEEEYAFGLIPNSGASVNPIAVPLDQATGTFSYSRRDSSLTDLVYTVWFSEDLTTWTQDTGAIEGTPVLNGAVETVPVTLSTLPGDPLPAKLFIQVRANTP